MCCNNKISNLQTIHTLPKHQPWSNTLLTKLRHSYIIISSNLHWSLSVSCEATLAFWIWNAGALERSNSGFQDFKFWSKCSSQAVPGGAAAAALEPAAVHQWGAPGALFQTPTWTWTVGSGTFMCGFE